MIILIRKRMARLCGLCLLIFCAMAATILLYARDFSNVSASGSASLAKTSRVVIIDAGHGGEDGGAVAADGTIESGVNLAVATRLSELLQFCGQPTKMTRAEDISIYSDGAETLHEKKVSDLKNRVALVNETPGAVLISIHQNCLPQSPSVHGAQAFYNSVDDAQILAQSVQETLNRSINPDNAKKIKRIPSTIYLMKNVTAPAMLIECGFLSNPSETELLKDSSYQTKLAIAIAAGVLCNTAGEEVS